MVENPDPKLFEENVSDDGFGGGWDEPMKPQKNSADLVVAPCDHCFNTVARQYERLKQVIAEVEAEGKE